MQHFFEIISTIGDTKASILLLLVSSACFYFYKNKKDGLLIFSAVTLSTLTTLTLKHLFKISRPIEALIVEDGYRFPSGHATMSATIFAIVFYLSFKYIHHKVWRWTCISFASAWMLLVSYARLYLGVHILIDVLAGAVIGVGSVYVLVKYFKHLRII